MPLLQKSPELRDVVQEVFNSPGWVRGKDLAVVITGSGHRTADSFVEQRCFLELSRCPLRYCNPTVACSWNLTTARFDCGPCSPCEPLDPTAPAVFDVLEQIFTELASLFPDTVFHQGADEVLDPAEGFVHELCWQVRIVCLIAGAGPSRTF